METMYNTAERGMEKQWALVQVILGSCIIALCAQITIPLYPVPFTGQTLGVMLVGVTLGPRRAACTATLYLLEGACGCPVFAGGSSGAHHLMGPTGGYLMSYPLVAYLCSRTAMRGLQGMLVPFLQLGLGAMWLSWFLGWKSAIALGFSPFVSIEMMKVFLIRILRRKI